MVEYNATIIREYADKLYKQANTAIIVSTVFGVLIGGFIFFILDEPVYAIFGALIFGGVGYFFGQSRAFQLQLQAQTALCQVKIEENTRFINQQKSQREVVSAFQPEASNLQTRVSQPQGMPQVSSSNVPTVTGGQVTSSQSLKTENEVPDIDLQTALKQITSESENDRSHAIQILHSFGQQAIPSLIEIIKFNPDGGVKLAACQALVKFGDNAIPELKPLTDFSVAGSTLITSMASSAIRQIEGKY